jgi:hypothetical protein
MIFTPTRLAAEIDKGFRQLGRLESNIFNGYHHFVRELSENNKVHFIQTEKFTDSMVSPYK